MAHFLSIMNSKPSDEMSLTVSIDGSIVCVVGITIQIFIRIVQMCNEIVNDSVVSMAERKKEGENELLLTLKVFGFLFPKRGQSSSKVKCSAESIIVVFLRNLNCHHQPATAIQTTEQHQQPFPVSIAIPIWMITRIILVDCEFSQASSLHSES